MLSKQLRPELIDTHCHLNFMAKNTHGTKLTDQECIVAKKIIDEASLAGVRKIINVGTSLAESNNSIMLAQKYKQVFATIGIHPNDTHKSWMDDIQVLKKLLTASNSHKIVAVGECGLDFHYVGYDAQQQKDMFKAHIELALEYRLPLVIHVRDAYDELMTCLEEFKNHGLRGVMHCFSASHPPINVILDFGFMVGVGGSITYPKNQKLRDIITSVGLSPVLLETDAPFLPPQNIRGKQNSPDQIPELARYLSSLLGIPYDEVARQTTQNAESVFNLK